MNNQFSNISEILNDIVFDKNKINFSVKKAVAFGFWKNIAGCKFASFSYPYDIKGKTLFVSVKNPQVMQELIFCQNMILSKISDYFSPLDIEINSIRYNYKNFAAKESVKSQIIGDNSLTKYDEDEVSGVELTNFEKEELKKVTNSISKLAFLDETLKNKYSNNIVNSYKVKKLRNSR